MPAAATYRVEAYNVSHASENKIHDDQVAQKLGFSGGLVPGVEMFAYCTHPVVAHWGRDWLEHGHMTCRFGKPFYDGHTAEIEAHARDGGLDLTLTSDGQTCASAQASLPAPVAPPALAAFEHRLPPPLAQRPPADATSLAPGTWLGLQPFAMTRDIADRYLADVRETLPLYAADGLVHPGLLLRLCNSALRESVLLGPWIHMGSDVRNHGVVHVGEEVGVRARVLDNYERKGHRFVDLDCLVVAGGSRVAAHVRHTAIYALRHLRQ